MKLKIWDILTILILLFTISLCLLFLAVFLNPNSGINPFPPPTLPPTVMIPTSTPTLGKLPATWTPNPKSGNPAEEQNQAVKPFQTSQPSATAFVLASDTPGPTPTPTPENTSTGILSPTANQATADTYSATATQAAAECLKTREADPSVTCP